MPATLILEIQTEKSLQGQLWHGNNLLHCALEPRGGGGGGYDTNPEQFPV